MVNPVQSSNAVNHNDTANTASAANRADKIIQNTTSSANKSAFPQDRVTISDSAVQAQANSKPMANR